MKIRRSIVESIRSNVSWEEAWNSADQGLIACWERGRNMSLEERTIASQARAGQLVMLPWKGGVKKKIKKNEKFGTLFYLAMWQGLRGEDLNIDTKEEPLLRCTATDMAVIFTNDYAKYANAETADEDD